MTTPREIATYGLGIVGLKKEREATATSPPPILLEWGVPSARRKQRLSDTLTQTLIAYHEVSNDRNAKLINDIKYLNVAARKISQLPSIILTIELSGGPQVPLGNAP